MGTGNFSNNIGFEVLFNHAAIGILVADSNHRILMANPFLLQQLGYAKEEVNQLQQSQLIRHSLEEHFAIRKDGSVFPVEINGSTHHNADGHFTITYVTDISDRRTSENTRKELQIKMQEAAIKDGSLQRMNSFLNSLWNNTGAMIIVINPEGYIQWFNPAAERILGYKAGEVIDVYTPMILHDKQEVTQRAEEFSRQLDQPVEPGLETLTIKAKLNLLNEHEWHYYRKDGSSLPVSLTVSAIREAGVITGYIGIAIDMSERKQAETELRSALEKERDLNELKSRFVSLASHEFRTPLSAILSSTYLISKYETTHDQPKRTKHIQRIISSVNMLTDILNDFLSVGRIEEGRIQVRITTFDIGKHVGTIINEMEGLKKPLQNIYYAHHGIAQAYLDPTLLKHIVMNLVSNAIKFSPEESVISVRTQCDQEYFELSVKDKGIGITEEDRVHLFERFFRGNNVANVQGTGLGLHIVAKYAELMNGTVTCHSQPGKGTEFLVSVPVPQN
ncbi:sensor histidine kinase [Chitinophaga nivalis]|uniref:histidine kinase n=1 Tax=Chitinophaga nivalis TaxID=2991709 RepID=A0ABT3IGD4_9BACT|nr:PAS domain S-box protein [Chitinophaga nivalis]MCW3467293.1 PAS domain S-box protein [Chitinophaga nivalis]MCW3483015.1 PAS domain S-box protein [Chitinophaga nivalis]